MMQESFWPPPITWPRVLKDGSGMNIALGALIVSSIKANAEMWAHDYPPDIKKAFGPKSEKAKRQTRLMTIPFFSILLGGVIYSTWRLRQEGHGRLSFPAAFWHVYSLFALFWLFDLTILDWLFFVTLKPGFAILPGTEGMAGYDDYLFHLRAALPALPLMALPALLIALVMKRSGQRKLEQ